MVALAGPLVAGHYPVVSLPGLDCAAEILWQTQWCWQEHLLEVVLRQLVLV